MSLVSATFGLWTLVCLLLITSFLLLVFSYVVISEFQHVSLHKWRIRTLIPNRFWTVPRNLLNSVPNRFRTIFWYSVPNRTELWKSIPQTPTRYQYLTTVILSIFNHERNMKLKLYSAWPRANIMSNFPNELSDSINAFSRSWINRLERTPLTWIYPALLTERLCSVACCNEH